MEKIPDSNSAKSSCLLCENDNITDLEQCDFCKQVWFCKQHDKTNGDNQYTISNEEVDQATNDAVDINQNNKKSSNQDTNISNPLTGCKSTSHCHPHRPYGLSYCLPIKGI